MRNILVVAIATACACGSIKGDREIDASTDVPIDALDTRRCNLASPFGAPVAITEINTAEHEEGAYLSPDELTMYFSSTRAGTLGGFDIFMATRQTRTEQWRNIVTVTGVNTSAANERFPMVTSDGFTMYATVGGIPNYDVGVATRKSKATAFSSLAVAATINSASNDESGTILPDHSAIWFSSNYSGNYELYRAPRGSEQFENPLLVSGTSINNPTATDSSPVVTPDELTLFFLSNRAGGVGSYDVWAAKRTSVANGFDAPVNLQTVNTATVDVPTWVSADGCVLYVTRDLAGMYDLYVATRGM
jgi:hypothetical protein